GGDESEDRFILDDADEFPETEKFNREKAAIGFYLTGHPLENFREEIDMFTNLDFGVDVSELNFTSLGTVKMCGVITNLALRASKRGNRFATFDLIDFYGSGECVLFGTLLEQKGELIKNDTLVFVQAKGDENGDSIKLVIEDIMPIETLKERFSENIVINIFEKEDDVFDKLERIH